MVGTQSALFEQSCVWRTLKKNVDQLLDGLELIFEIRPLPVDSLVQKCLATPIPCVYVNSMRYLQIQGQGPDQPPSPFTPPMEEAELCANLPTSGIAQARLPGAHQTGWAVVQSLIGHSRPLLSGHGEP